MKFFTSTGIVMPQEWNLGAHTFCPVCLRLFCFCLCGTLHVAKIILNDFKFLHAQHGFYT